MGYVFFRYYSDDSLRWHVQRLDERVACMERSLTRGRARGGQFHGEGGFERLRVRLATDRLERRRARVLVGGRA